MEVSSHSLDQRRADVARGYFAAPPGQAPAEEAESAAHVENALASHLAFEELIDQPTTRRE